MTVRPRIIPCLLVHRGGLVKTVQFDSPKYVGDPLNAVRIFNEKAADELMVLDIDATTERREPRYELIAALARECRMPLCYGGGVSSADQIERIVSLGVEKVAIGSAAFSVPSLIESGADRVGSQSIAVVMDIRSDPGTGAAATYSHRATRRVEGSVESLALRAARSGAGEIILNSVDRDGTMQGYDTALVSAVRATVDLPITAVGGAGSLEQMLALVEAHPGVAAAAGSLFVFKGKYRAVLIQYPTRDQRAGTRGTSPNGGTPAP
jgi:cyclase